MGKYGKGEWPRGRAEDEIDNHHRRIQAMKDNVTFDYARFLDRVIEDGVTSVTREYAEPKGHHKRDGAIAGFNACRYKTPAELFEAFHQSGRDVDVARQGITADSPRADAMRIYQWHRYHQLQVEWVCNVMSYALQYNGIRTQPILPGQPTARAAMKYAEIVGVAVQPGASS